MSKFPLRVLALLAAMVIMGVWSVVSMAMGDFPTALALTGGLGVVVVIIAVASHSAINGV
jgi:hypothetical protein